MNVERLAFGALLILALSFGLGDLGQTTSFSLLVREAVRALLPVCLVLALLHAGKSGRWPRLPRQVAWPIAVWLTVLCLSAVLAPGNRAEALLVLTRPASGVLLAWSVFALTHTPERWIRLAHAMALGGLLVAVVGLAEASGVVPITSALASLHDGATPVGDVPRITSTLSHPNVAAIVLELSLPLLVAWAWSARSSRLLLAGGAAATLLALVLTFSRAGLLAALAGLALMAAQRGRPRMLGTVAVGLVVVGATLAWAAVADPGLDRRLTAGLDESSPLQPARTVFWSVALDMQRDHPWLGVGPDNFRWQFAAYSGIAADHLGIHAHNQYLEALADTGLVGLVAQVWLLGALVVTAWRQATLPRTARDGGVDEIAWPWRAAVLASLVVWVSHAMLDDFERFWPSSVAFWLLCGLSLRLVAGQAPQRRVALFGHYAQGQAAAYPSRASSDVAVVWSCMCSQLMSVRLRSRFAGHGHGHRHPASGGKRVWRPVTWPGPDSTMWRPRQCA